MGMKSQPFLSDFVGILRFPATFPQCNRDASHATEGEPCKFLPQLHW